MWPLLGLLLLVLPLRVGAQEAKVSLSVRNGTVREVLKKIESASPYRFFYSDDLSFFDSRVNAEYAETSVKKILQKLLDGSNLTYSVMENDAIVITPFNVKDAATVSGTVTDASGSPMAGVTVLLKGTVTGTTTDGSGRYSIKVSAVKQPVLAFSFIGCVPVEKRVSGGTVVDVSLSDDVQRMEDVVVIGYGTVKKKDLTGSVSSISGKELVKVPVATAAEAIAGRLAGVQVTTTEGNPDADIQIRVRGGGSISQDNSPLYIVDGFPSDDGLTAVNPADIESIDVLKDASSTAIYGARGANGVIVITTRKGAVGRSKVSYDGYVGFKKLDRFLDVLSPYEYVMAQYEIANMPDAASSAAENFESRYGRFEDLGQYRNRKGVDWQREVFGRSALTHNHNISISGGSQHAKYMVKYGHYSEEGIMLASSAKRDYIKISFDQKVTDRLKLSVNGSYTMREVRGSSMSGTLDNAMLGNTISYRPVLGPNDDDDALIGETEDDAGGAFLTNPIVRAEAQHLKKTYRTALFNGSLEYRIRKDLTVSVTGGLSAGNNRVETFFDERLHDVRVEKGGPYGSIEPTETMKLTESAYMTWTPTFGEAHSFSMMAGQEIVTSKSKYLLAGAMEFPNSDIGLGDLGLGATPMKPSSKISEERLSSFFGRIMYAFRDKYLVTVNLRADGSSKFAKENHWGYFPSVSAAWRIMEEPWMKRLDLFSNLKLRVSYGLSGNNRIGNNLFASTFSTTGYAADAGSVSTALQPTAIASPSLKWETTKSFDAGLDMGFLDGRINLVFDYYYNKTEDLLLRARIPGTSGYTTQYKNVGSMRNKGIELTLNTINIDRKKFRWTTDFNISFNRGRILGLNRDELGAQQSYLENSGWAKTIYDYIVQVGKPVGMIYGYITDGFYTAADFEGYDAGTNTWKLRDGVPYIKGDTKITPGDIKFKWIGGQTDERGNPVITPDHDRTIIGNTNPKFIGGLNNTFSYRNFDLGIFVNFSYGNKVLNANKLAYTNTYNSYRNFLGVMRDRFRLINDQGAFVTDLGELAELNKDAKIWRVKAGELPRFAHSWAVEDASFLRINNITLGYTVPRKLAEKCHLQNLRIYATAYNIYTWTSYSGFDPEVSALRSNPLTPGVDYSAYPKSFSMIFGVNITF